LSKRGALVLIFVLTLGTLGLMVSGLPGKILAIREIVVEGGERIPVNDLRRMIDIEVGDNLLLADEQGAERRLRAHAWVKAARVERRYPRLHVRVQARRPFAAVRLHSGGLVWCDDAGYVLTAIAEPEATAPVIGGLGSPEDTADGPRIGTDADWRNLRQLLRFDDGFVGPIERVRVSPVGIDAYTQDDVRVRLPQDGLTRALQRLRLAWPALRERVTLGSVDLRFPGELVYEKKQP